MHSLASITANNYITYKKKNVLEFEPDSITLILGKNKDRKDKGSSSGAGKSLIASILPQIIFNTAPLPMKSKKNPKEGFKSDTFQIIEFVDSHRNKFSIKKYFKGTARLQILKNGKDKKFREKSESEAYLKKLFPLNEEQFYSLVYLDTKRPPVFQYGTDTQRHQFIEQLFSLNIYDLLAADVKKDWDKSKLLVQEIELLDRQLMEKSENLTGDPDKLKKKHEELLKKTEELRERVSDLIKTRDKCKTYIALSDGISLDLKTVKEKLSYKRSKLKSLRKKLKNIEEQNSKQEAFKSVQEKRKELEEKLEDYKDVKIDKTIQDTIKADEMLLANVETLRSDNNVTTKQLKKIKEELEELEGFLPDFSKSVVRNANRYSFEKIEKNKTRDKVLLKELRVNLNDTLEHLKGHEDQSCPVCSTLLDKKTLEQVLQSKKDRLEKTEKRVEVLDQMFRYKNVLNSIANLKDQQTETQAKIQKIEYDEDELNKRIEDNRRLLDRMRRKVIYRKNLKELPNIEKVEYVDPSSIEQNINTVEEAIEKYARMEQKIEQLDKLQLPFSSIKKAKEKKQDTESALSQYQPLLDKIQSKLNLVSVNAIRAESLSGEINSLSQQISDLQLKTTDYKIQTVLRKAFGPRGIRKQKVAEISLAIEATLNEYAAEVFDFPIRFELIVTDTRYSVLAHRNNEVADVKTLSGAESRYFSLLLLMCFLKFAPPEKRLDIVFLDEIEANLDQPFKRRFVDVFLPKLREIVSKVVVITPLTENEIFIPKAIVYTATKENGVTTLRKTR